jgi:hypothetical protein
LPVDDVVPPALELPPGCPEVAVVDPSSSPVPAVRDDPQ